MSSSILKYGQIIRIRSYEKPNTFLTSKSYTDQNLYFQIYNTEDTFLSGSTDIINIANYRESLFEVLPTSSFEINDDMNSQKIEAKKAQSAPRAKTQQQQFKAIISEKRGNGISFGDKVIFRHLDSQYYMYGSFDCASSGIGAFKIELKKQLSEKIIFQLMSYRTYEKEGDQMSIYAPFKIYHRQTQCYVSYCFERLFLDSGVPRRNNISGNKLQLRDKDFPVDAPKIKEAFYQEGEEALGEQGGQEPSSRVQQVIPTQARFLIINQNIPKRVFKLVTHNQFEKKINKQKIRNHDIVYFIHTEKDQYMCPSNFSSQVFLKKRLDEPDLTDIFDGLWEIEEVKTVEEKPDQIIGKSKAMSRRTEGIKDTSQKRFGNISSLMPITGANLSHTYLTATVGNPMLDGQTRAGFVGGNDEVEEQGDKGSKKKDKYILRHLASGRIIYVSEDLKRVELQQCSGHQKKPILLQSIDSKFQDGALVQFSFKTKDMTGIKPKIMKYFLGITAQPEQKKEEIEERISEQDEEYEQGRSIEEEGEQNQTKIEQAYSSKFQRSRLGLSLDSSEHGFRIYKINEEAKQLCLFVLSSQQILSKFTKLIGEYVTLDELLEHLNVFLLNNVIEVLRNLIGFIYNCDYNKIAESGNNPNSKKQRIFDELGMIELVTRLVEQINNSDFYSEEGEQELSLRGMHRKQKLKNLQDRNKNSQYRKIRTVYQLGYKLLQSIAASNDLMKIRISKYMSKYLNHIMIKPNRTVYRSIQEFFDGNYLALEEINDNYIQDLISHIEPNDPDPADLSFLSCLCLCRERTVRKNQLAVFRNFYSDNSESEPSDSKYSMEQTLEANKFKFRQDQQKMQILSRITPISEPQYRTLSELYEECTLMRDEGDYNQDKNHWSYFMQYLNLLADVCVQRNQNPLDYIKKSLPLKTLVAFLCESTVKKNLLFQPFIRLVHHAFVETSSYQEINRITKVKEWNQLGNFNIPKAKIGIPPDIQKTKSVIVDYIKRINKKAFELKKKEKAEKAIEEKDKQKKGEDSKLTEPETIDFDIESHDRLINVKTFLQILKSTLNLGFWPEIQEMKKMVPYLLKVLRFDIEYANRVLHYTKQTDMKNGENQHLSPSQYQQLVYGRIKQQLKLNKPNIVLLVQCKILTAKILNIIIDYEYNVRVSIITKYFKDVMEFDVDLSNYIYDNMEFIKKWKSHNEYQLFEPTNDKEGYLLIQKLWKDKVQEILVNRNIFSKCIEENINHTLVFFEAFVYSNQQLTNLTLELIRRVTSQRQEILRTFKDIIFVAGGHLKNLAIRGVQTTRSALLNLTIPSVRQQTLISSSINLWLKINQNQQKRSSPKLGVIQELASLTMSMMKSRANPTPYDASNFYSSTELYPYFDLIEEPDRKAQVQQDQDGSYLIISEKDQNLPLNQNLIKSQDHHLLIIDFIKLMSDPPTQNPLPMRALHAAYNFLTALIWNNNQNKRQLQNILAISLCHLKYNVGCIDFFKQMYTNNKKLVKKGQIKNLIQKIIDYANELSIKKYQKSKLMDFLRIAVIFDDQGYDINQNMVMELISQKQVSSQNKIVYLKAQNQTTLSLSNTINSSYEFWIREYTTEYEKVIKSYDPLNVSPQLFYVATFFEVFSALIENQNVVNIGKASNMHPIDFLLDILDKSGRCWIVVRHLRAYLNRLYYFEKRTKDTSLFTTFTDTDLPIIKNQLRGIVQLIYNTTDYNVIRIKNPVRYCFLGSYVFLSLQQLLHSLNLIFSTKAYSDYISLAISMQQQKNKHVKLFILLEIIEMLQFLLKTIDGRYINKYIARVSTRLRTFVASSPLRFIETYMEISKNATNDNINKYKITSDQIPSKKAYIFHDGKGFWRHLIDWNSFKDQQQQREKDMNKVQKRVEPNPSETKEAQEQRKRNSNLDIIFLGNIDKKIQTVKIKNPKPSNEAKEMKEEGDKGQVSLHKNLTTSQSVRFRVKNQRFASQQDKNIVINQRRKKLVKFLQVNETFKEFTQDQVSKCLFDVFAELDSTSKLRYEDILVVGNAEVISSIVKMNEIDPQSIRSEFKLLIIRLLTNFIQRKSPIFNEDIQKWSSANKLEAEKIKQPQNFLYNCGVASFLSQLIINDLRYSIEMGNAILMLGISLLFGKNDKNQNQIFKLIKEDEKNLLISQLTNLIKDCGASIAAIRVGGDTKEYNPTGVNYSDTYDFYIDNQKIMKRQFIYVPETVEEQKEFDQKVVNMQYTFILLKNLCEGNNEIKHYIRDQVMIEEQGKSKPDSVNFLTLSVTELRRMFSNFNIDIIKVPVSIIDFIYEVTQIPCLDNQLFICKNTSFFSDFATLQTTIQNLIQQKQLVANQKNILIIFDLYSSNIKTVISCLEGNKTDIYLNLSTQELCKYFVKVLAFYIKHLPLLQRCGQIKTADDLNNLLKKKKLHESYYMNMFQATSVIVKLSKKKANKDFQDNINTQMKICKINQIVELLKKNLLGIEIKMESPDQSVDQTQTLFFPRHNVFGYISRSTRNFIMEHVDRSTQRDKIIGLLDTKEQINQQIEYNYILANQYKFFNIRLSITNEKIEYYMNLGLYIAAIICALMLYCAAVVYYPFDHMIQYDLGNQYTILRALSIVQFIVAIIYLCLWSKNHIYLAIKKYQLSKSKIEQGQVIQTRIMTILFKIPGIKTIYCLKQDGQFGTMVLFMFGSIMGMFYRIEWYSILLMNLLMANLQVLNNILQALKASMKMLGMLSIFGASFIAFFSVFSIYYYVESIYPQNHPKQYCQSVISCIIELYIKEQIGNDMQMFRPGRFIYDMIYVVFMDLLFGNIVGGVLIDNFASLRGQREEMMKDKTEKCFICGIQRQTLEKKSLDLKTHYTTGYHKLWNYVFYLYYLKQITKKTGLEEIIERKYLLQDVSWIPQATSEEHDMGDLLSRLQNLLKEQQATVKTLELKE